MIPSPSEQVARRTVLFYRVIVVVLLLVMVAWGLSTRRYLELEQERTAYEKQKGEKTDQASRTATGQASRIAADQASRIAADQASPTAAGQQRVRSVNLAERVAAYARAAPDLTDESETYYLSETATVHMHIMGRGQLCPLHIHRRTEEATVIVSGTADVVHVYGRNGQSVRQSEAYPPGSVVYSPPFCGHEWYNPSDTALLGNLVIASPPFDGNLYVKANDKRTLQGGEPFAYRPEQETDAFLAGTETHRLVRWPLMRGRLASLLVKNEFVFELEGPGPTLFYVLQGEGVLEGREPHPAPMHQLLMFPSGGQVKIRAGAGAPLALLVFNPERGTEEPLPPASEHLQRGLAGP